MYGTKSLVGEYSASIVATVNKYHRSDMRIELFGHFLSDFWDTETLCIFLHAQFKYTELLKIPYLEFSTENTKLNKLILIFI